MSNPGLMYPSFAGIAFINENFDLFIRMCWGLVSGLQDALKVFITFDYFINRCHICISV